MANGLTRREFLKLGGQAVALSGAACAASGLCTPRSAQAETSVEVDGREMVARVGDTFATIQLVPRFSKTDTPQAILAKVQYGTDPSFVTYAESAEVLADSYPWTEGGKHVGPDGSSDLVVKPKYKFLKDQWEIEPGDLIYNETDGSVMVVSEVVDNQTVAGELSGGVNNCWNYGDKWRIHRTLYRLEVRLTGLQPSTRYYYRVLLRREGEVWPVPRAAHSFWTRRAAGEAFRFVIVADAHRTARGSLSRRHWPEWDTLVGTVQGEQADFIIDLGDTWYLARGNGKPYTRSLTGLYSTVMRPARDGVAGYRGVSDLCGDCGYYLARGNHEGLSEADNRRRRAMLATLLKLFVPNPDGTTYPQGGSTDADYDQGYFAFEWGDALFVVMDVVKYKDPRRLDGTPARFHIGEAQLEWLTGVLENSAQGWKFIFMHHLFGGGTPYGRGGAAFAFDHEHAQVQTLAEQHGAHIFYAHDHLLASDMANGVLYYCCGCSWGGQLAQVVYDKAEELYPNGFVPASCNSEPPTCENNGYIMVEVGPAQARIQYKNYLGEVVDEALL